MIRCVKCGKLYNYEKTNGICPNCARYNRPDSSELEQDLHERYDSTPNIHSAQAHEEAHRRNYDRSSHRTDEYGAQQYSPQGMNGEPQRTPSRKRVVMITVVLVVVIVVVSVVALGFTAVRDIVDEYDELDLLDEIIGEDGVYVEDGWKSELGPILSEIDWDDTVLYLTEEEQRTFLEYETARADEYSGCYYTVTLEIQNNSEEDLDLTGVTKEDVTICMDDTQVECRLLSLSGYDVIEADYFGYVDCVIFLTDEILQPYIDDDVACNVNGNIYFSDGQLSESDNQLEFSFDEYFYAYDDGGSYGEESWD